MANQRPIRRAPFPRWRRGKRKPVRWIDGASSRATVTGTCTLEGKDLTCDPDSNPDVLLFGDTDWEWADSNEVRVDRIVGSFSWRSQLFLPGDPAVIIGEPAPYVVRIGILAVEDCETTFPTIDLFDPEALEEFQWMYLYQSTGEHHYDFTNSLASLSQWHNREVDVRTRRKLGKKDSVLLYGQCKQLSSNNPSAGTTGLTPRMSHQLRTIIRS